MKPIIALLCVMLVIPSVAAMDIPPLTAEFSTHFIAGFYTTDGGSVGVPAEYSPLFGDSGTVNTENTILVQVPFSYNITNLRVSATQANCGTLGTGESISVVLRVNLVASSLSGSCANGAAANSFTLDTDTVALAAGDRVSLSYTTSGILLGTRDIRLGVSLEGVKDQNATTEAVPDMTNEILDAFNVLIPIPFFALVIIWAEIKKEKELYALAVLTGAFEVLFLWPDLTPQMRTLLIIITFFLAWRLYSAANEDKNGA